MINKKSFAVHVSLTLSLILFLCNDGLACRGEGCIYYGTLNGELARGYGQISAVLALGIAYFQVRRAGWRLTTCGLLLLFVPISLVHAGWHYSGRRGDAGFQELYDARQATIFIGMLFVWQVAAMIRLIWREKRQSLVTQAS